MGIKQRVLVSESEFLRLPESTDKTELIDGDVVVTPSPTLKHQSILRRLVAALTAWSEESSASVTIGLAPLDVRFRTGRILQPDLFVLLGQVPEDHEGPIDRVPEICAEVTSRNRVYDRVTKRYLYADGGVREFWLIEPSGPIERYTGEGLADSEDLNDRLETPLLPGLSIDIAALLGS